ncbi:hypothetical protein T484DRAFT_2479364 [Baffinella frigidus]|nr:hypothetical protein T484DRAFT_2479364 [Cryptophyta sp. CCMP2293]
MTLAPVELAPRVTAYEDLAHPLSGVQTRAEQGKRAIIRLSARDVVEMESKRRGGGVSEEMLDRTVACGVRTLFVSKDNSGCRVEGVPELAEFEEGMRSDLEWASAHLRYGGDLVVPGQASDNQGGTSSLQNGDPGHGVRHSLGKSLPEDYKSALQNQLDAALFEACNDAILSRDRTSSLPHGSPFREVAVSGPSVVEIAAVRNTPKGLEVSVRVFVPGSPEQAPPQPLNPQPRN